MSDTALLSELIGDIYEASYQPGYWPVVIEKICRLTQARSGAIFIRDLSTQEGDGFYPYGISDQLLNEYAKYNHQDPGFAIMQSIPVGIAVNMLTPERHELESPQYHADIRTKYDIGFTAGSNVVADEYQVVGLGLHRGIREGSFGEVSLCLIGELIPHLQRALRIHREFIRLRVEKQALTAGFANLIMGLVLLDHLGTPVYINPVARDILETHPAITLSNDIITPTSSQQAAQLRRLIIDCLQASQVGAEQAGGVIGLSHPATRHPLAVMVKPVATSELANMVDGIPVYVAIYLNDPARPLAISPESIGQLYGLTRTESQIAIAMVNGMSVEEIAQAHARSINTVRTQVRALFHKTNTNSQTDLIRLLLTSAMP